jgi:hypothetical protein
MMKEKDLRIKIPSLAGINFAHICLPYSNAAMLRATWMEGESFYSPGWWGEDIDRIEMGARLIISCRALSLLLGT